MHVAEESEEGGIELRPVSKSPLEQLKASLAELDPNFAAVNPPVQEYVESVCNNHKLAREIRETLQILLMKEKSEIEHIKEKAYAAEGICEKCKSCLDDDKDATMEDERSEMQFLGK